MIKNIYRRLRARIERMLPKDHQRIFSDIYNQGVWGKRGELKYYSGTGSDEPYALPYTEVITNFIRENNIKSVVDLGCGDFRIGRRIVQACSVDYRGADVVADLIAFNRSKFESDRVKFFHVNIVKDKLPPGQLCLIRQVFQHLSNADIEKVLEKCKQYEYLIVTEHHPGQGVIIPNVDQEIHAGIRLGYNSGVYLDKPPFNRKVEELLVVYPAVEKDSKIVTFRVFP